MSNTYCLILAHGKQQECFDRHLPLWEKHRVHIEVVCPKDDVVKTDYVVHPFGMSSHVGPDQITRIRCALGLFLQSPMRHCVMFEYDSLWLQDDVSTLPGLGGIVHANTQPKRFVAPFYPLAPWTLDKASAEKMWRVARERPVADQGGCADRALAAWAHLAGVPLHDHEPKGYAENTFAPQSYPKISEALARGGRAFHGIKDKETLEFILAERKKYE